MDDNLRQKTQFVPRAVYTLFSRIFKDRSTCCRVSDYWHPSRFLRKIAQIAATIEKNTVRKTAKMTRTTTVANQCGMTKYIPNVIIILLAVQIEASFVSPLPRSKRNLRHCGSFHVSLDFSMALNQTARSIVPLKRTNSSLSPGLYTVDATFSDEHSSRERRAAALAGRRQESRNAAPAGSNCKKSVSGFLSQHIPPQPQIVRRLRNGG